MANAATTQIAIQVPVLASNTDIARGVRVVLASDGTVSVADATKRGDYITLQAIPANGQGLAAPINAGGSVPVVAAANCTLADAAYSAASGQVTNVSTNAVLIGKWKQTTANATLGVIELESAA